MPFDDLKSVLPRALRFVGGESVNIRFAEDRDAEALQVYFCSLSRTSRYNRFMGDVGEFSPTEMARLTRGNTKNFTMIAETSSPGQCVIIGEMRYVYDVQRQSGEFGLSVEDGWHGRGVGRALLEALERCVVALGVPRLFGETLQSNDKMKQLGRKAGFALSRPAGDWTVIQFDKQFDGCGFVAAA